MKAPLIINGTSCLVHLRWGARTTITKNDSYNTDGYAQIHPHSYLVNIPDHCNSLGWEADMFCPILHSTCSNRRQEGGLRQRVRASTTMTENKLPKLTQNRPIPTIIIQYTFKTKTTVWNVNFSSVGFLVGSTYYPERRQERGLRLRGQE